MIEPAPGVRDADILSIPSQLIASRHHVLAILLAARIRVLRCSDEPDRMAMTGGVHFAKCVGEQRMPVTHANEDRQRMAHRRESLLEPARLTTGDVGDWRDAAEQ